MVACGDSESSDEATPAVTPPPAPTTIPLFVVAGQSNAEGNVRLAGLEAVRAGLPSHNDALSTQERAAARDGYRQGVGDWCNPDEDYSDAHADAAIDALRAGGLDHSGVSSSYTIAGATGAAYRWRHQDASYELGEPYQRMGHSAHPAHTTEVVPFGVGFGVWDDGDMDVLFYGPELGFGMHINQNQALPEFDVIKVAMGGSSLFGHWAPEGPMTKKLYEKTDFFLAEKNKSKVAGLVWFQGFNDQFEESARNAYAANLTKLIEDFRARYDENLPVVIVEARKVGDLTQIANAQRSVAEAMDNVSIVESDGLSDCFHYGATSQLVVGQRSAQAMLSLMGIE